MATDTCIIGVGEIEIDTSQCTDGSDNYSNLRVLRGRWSTRIGTKSRRISTSWNSGCGIGCHSKTDAEDEKDDSDTVNDEISHRHAQERT